MSGIFLAYDISYRVKLHLNCLPATSPLLATVNMIQSKADGEADKIVIFKKPPTLQFNRSRLNVLIEISYILLF